jgi:DNA polymerase-3 subunit delta'
LQITVFNNYPWLDHHWLRLFAGGELHHATLLAGHPGVGKLVLAEAMAAGLLCESPGPQRQHRPCGTCQSCRWFLAGNHPDYRRISPDQDDDPGDEDASAKANSKKKPSDTIKVDQIRALEDFVYVGSHRRGKRLIVISPAEAMNHAAANSLLKILEEPPATVYFILVSSKWRLLLPTVKSRCRKVLISRPDPLRAQAWLTSEAVGVGIRDAEKLLQITGGSPLTAATWAEQGWLDAYQSSIDVLTHPDEGPLAMAGRWESQLRASPERSLESLVAQIQKWLVDLIQVKLIGKPRFHLAWRENLQILAEPSSLGRLFNCYNELMEIRAVAGHPLNTQLFLEDLATRYLRALKPEKS